MKPDGIHSLSFEAYKAADGVSKSMLDYLAHPYTPAHLRAYLDEPQPEPTDAQRFGAIMHRSIFEPDTMKGAFAVKPIGMNFTTKEGKAWRDGQSDKTILTHAEATKIERSVAAVWKHPIAKRLLAGSDFERSLFASDSGGTLRKARLDVLPKSGNVLPDLKTCESAAAEDFEKQVLTYRYHVQAAYYLDICKLLGIPRTRFVFICVEKTSPFCVAVHELDTEVVEWGRRIYQRDLAVYRQCVKSNEWPGYPDDIGVVGVPVWARKQMEDTL